MTLYKLQSYIIGSQEKGSKVFGTVNLNILAENHYGYVLITIYHTKISKLNVFFKHIIDQRHYLYL